MNDPLRVSEDKTLCGLRCYPDGLIEWEWSFSVFDEFLNVTAAHKRLNHERVTVFFTEVVDVLKYLFSFNYPLGL